MIEPSITTLFGIDTKNSTTGLLLDPFGQCFLNRGPGMGGHTQDHHAGELLVARLFHSQIVHDLRQGRIVLL